MGQRVTRRRFGLAAIVAASAGTAGCTLWDAEYERAVGLEIRLEDENGDPVSEGVVLTIEHEDEDFSVEESSARIEDGRYTAPTLIVAGEYTVTVESANEEFDAVERTVTLPGTDDPDEAERRAETITITLAGATSDAERVAAREQAEPNVDETSQTSDEDGETEDNGETEEGGNGETDDTAGENSDDGEGEMEGGEPGESG